MMDVKNKIEEQSSNTFDVLILGGGMVGLTLACLLAQQNYTVALIDQKNLHPTENLPPHETLRLSAINPAAEALFKSMDVWSLLPDTAKGAFYKMEVWDGSGPGVIHFDSSDLSVSHLGHMIFHTDLQHALHERLKNFSNVKYFSPVQPKDYVVTENEIILEIEEAPHQLQGRVLVGADGANSWVRKKMSPPIKKLDYEQSALVATVKTTLPHGCVARQRFLQSQNWSGTLAFLPLYDPHLHSIVWTDTPEKIQQLTEISEADFLKCLTAQFDRRLGDVIETSACIKFPLKQQQAKYYSSERVVLIGDAAHTVHPLAGQGLNLGLRDVEVLSRVFQNATLSHEDIGALQVLKRYEREQKAHNQRMIAGIDGLWHLFRQSTGPLPFLRQLGLQIVDRASFIKRFFMQQAMGF